MVSLFETTFIPSTKTDLLFLIQSINLSFMHHLKVQKLKVKKFIDNKAIDLWSPWNFVSKKDYEDNIIQQ